MVGSIILSGNVSEQNKYQNKTVPSSEEFKVHIWFLIQIHFKNSLASQTLMLSNPSPMLEENLQFQVGDCCPGAEQCWRLWKASLVALAEFPDAQSLYLQLHETGGRTEGGKKKKLKKHIFHFYPIHSASCLYNSKKSLLKMKGNRITLFKIKQYFVTLNFSLGFRSSNKKCSKHSVEF